MSTETTKNGPTLLDEVVAAAEEYLGHSLEADDLQALAANLLALIPPDVVTP